MRPRIRKSGNDREARGNYAAIIPINDRLLTEDPTNQEDLQILANVYWNLKDLSRTAGDHAGAIDHWRKAIAVNERMVAMTPDNAQYASTLASANSYMGMLYAESAGAHSVKGTLEVRIPTTTNATQVQQWREARSWYQKSFNLYQDMKSKGTLSASEVTRPNEVAGTKVMKQPRRHSGGNRQKKPPRSKFLIRATTDLFDGRSTDDGQGCARRR